MFVRVAMEDAGSCQPQHWHFYKPGQLEDCQGMGGGFGEQHLESFFSREMKTTCVTKEKHAIPWRISYSYLSRMEICELCSCLCPYANNSGVSLFVKATGTDTLVLER